MTQTAQQLFDLALTDDKVRAKLNDAAAAISEGPHPNDYSRDLNAVARLKLPDALMRWGTDKSEWAQGRYQSGPRPDLYVKHDGNHEALARLCVWAVATGVEV